MTALPMEQPWRRAQQSPFDVLGGQQFGVQVQPLARRKPQRGMFAPGPTLSVTTMGDTQPQITDLRSPIGDVAPMFSGGAELRQHMDEQGQAYAEQQSRRRDKTRKIVGTIADGLLGYAAGMGNQFAMAQVQNNMAMRRERSQQEAEQAQYYQRRFDMLEDYRTKKGIDLEMGVERPETSAQERMLARFNDPNTPDAERRQIAGLLWQPVLGTVNNRPVMIDRSQQYLPQTAAQAPTAGGDDDWEYSDGGAGPQTPPRFR